MFKSSVTIFELGDAPLPTTRAICTVIGEDVIITTIKYNAAVDRLVVPIDVLRQLLATVP